MKKMCFIISMVGFLFILNGCSIFPSPLKMDIHYYDIGFPKKKINPGIGINVMPFSGGLGTESRMIFRDNVNRIKFDAYNRWSFSPAKLIQRYISLSFDDQKISKVAYYISGEVLRFDGDLINKTANLSIQVDIRTLELNKLISSEIYSTSVPVKEETATAYASAMEEAMAQIIDKIGLQIKHSKGK